jgi:hypothetical protein
METSVPVWSTWPYCCQRAGHLQGHHGAGEKTRQDHDGQTADPDEIHLRHDVVAIMRARRHIPERAPGQQIEFLDGDERVL